MVGELKKHAALDDFNNPLKLLLAREYRNAGQPARAEDVYEKLLKASADMDAYRGLFAVYKAEGRQGAVKLLRRLDDAIRAASPEGGKKDTPNASKAAHARAMLAVLREDGALVKALLPVAQQRILKGSGSTYRLRALLAVLAERTGNLDVAEALYRSCFSKDGKVLLTGERRQIEQQLYGGLLTVLSLAHKPTATVELCKQGLEHADATNRVLFHLEMARALMILGRSRERWRPSPPASTPRWIGRPPRSA